jgi:hypothetical protein
MFVITLFTFQRPMGSFGVVADPEGFRHFSFGVRTDPRGSACFPVSKTWKNGTFFEGFTMLTFWVVGVNCF